MILPGFWRRFTAWIKTLSMASPPISQFTRLADGVELLSTSDGVEPLSTWRPGFVDGVDGVELPSASQPGAD